MKLEEQFELGPRTQKSAGYKLFPNDLITRIICSDEEMAEAQKYGDKRIIENHEGKITIYFYKGKGFISDIVITTAKRKGGGEWCTVADAANQWKKS